MGAGGEHTPSIIGQNVDKTIFMPLIQLTELKGKLMLIKIGAHEKDSHGRWIY
jgi:hypothetical protein